MKDYKAYFEIKESPEIVFKGLTNPDIIRLWTGNVVEMSTEEGSEFSLWDGAIVGKNLEFEENRKIVQQWYFGDSEPSIVTMLLHPHRKGTSLELRHTNIPEADYDNMVEGWNAAYMGALAEFYEEEEGGN
ncbi:MAG: ATPase [Bacteroidetes bacterium]|nr:ATPase [Bacteroidota bacterium]